VHAEKGDGGLTDDERRTLEACPHAHLVTIPGSVLFSPNEVPGQIADTIVEAVSHAGDQQRPPERIIGGEDVPRSLPRSKHAP